MWPLRVLADEPFHNFGAWRSGDRWILCSSGTSCDGFGSSKIVKGFVGWPHIQKSFCRFRIELRFIFTRDEQPRDVVVPEDVGGLKSHLCVFHNDLSLVDLKQTLLGQWRGCQTNAYLGLYIFSLSLSQRGCLMGNQMHQAKGKGYLKWTPHKCSQPSYSSTYHSPEGLIRLRTG